MKHVLITGGTGLFGNAIIKFLIKNDYKVTFTTTSEEKGDKLLTEFSNSSMLNCLVVKFTSESSIDKFVNKNKKLQFTHLLNNARTLEGLKLKKNGVAVKKSFQLEFFLAVILAYKLTIGFKNSLKSIVNVSSIYGIVAPNKALYLDGYDSSPIQYGTAKSAQIHLTKELAVRLAPNNIRVNSISFGGIEGRVDNAFKKRYANLVPLERMIKISEILEPILFLLDENKSSAITGHNLIVDGGWCSW